MQAPARRGAGRGNVTWRDEVDRAGGAGSGGDAPAAGRRGLTAAADPDTPPYINGEEAPSQYAHPLKFFPRVHWSRHPKGQQLGVAIRPQGSLFAPTAASASAVIGAGMTFLDQHHRDLAAAPITHHGERAAVSIAAMALEAQAAGDQRGQAHLRGVGGARLGRATAVHLRSIQTHHTHPLCPTAQGVAVGGTALAPGLGYGLRPGQRRGSRTGRRRRRACA
jgi:hypothetical protein